MNLVFYSEGLGIVPFKKPDELRMKRMNFYKTINSIYG